MMEHDVQDWLISIIEARLGGVQHKVTLATSGVLVLYLRHEAQLGLNVWVTDYQLRLEGKLKLSYRHVHLRVEAKQLGPKASFELMWTTLERELARKLKAHADLKRIKRARAHTASPLKCLEPGALLTVPEKGDALARPVLSQGQLL
jgi:hypothetical protein